MSVFQVSRRSSGKAKHLRAQGIIPMGLVERSNVTLPLQVSQEHFNEAARQGGHTQVEIQIEGESKPRKAIFKAIDMDPMRHEITHITLQEVTGDSQVKMDVPVVAVGHNEDSKAAGVTLTAVTTSLKVRGRVDAIPESIEVDVSNLHAGEHISASDVTLPEGVELMSPADAIVFSNTIDKAPELAAEPEEMEATGVPEDPDAVEAS